MESLRGEIGASMMQTRIMETMLLFVVDTLAGEFNEVKRLMNDTIDKGRGKWINTINEYRRELGLTWEKMREIDRKTLKEKIREYDTKIWLEGMDKKPVLKYYKLGKQKIEYDNCYRNNSHSAFLAKARTNSLQLEEHKGRGNQNYDTTCKLCGEEEEDIAHFLVKCKELEGERDSRLMNGTQQSTEEKLLRPLLLLLLPWLCCCSTSHL